MENKLLTFVKSDQLVGVLIIVLQSPSASGSGKSTLLNGLIGKAEARFKGQLPTYVMNGQPPKPHIKKKSSTNQYIVRQKAYKRVRQS